MFAQRHHLAVCCMPESPHPAMRRDEDHLALFMELLGRMPWRVASAGTHARDFFNHRGELRHIKKLHEWPLHQVLADKYSFPDEEVLRPYSQVAAQRLHCPAAAGLLNGSSPSQPHSRSASPSIAHVLHFLALCGGWCKAASNCGRARCAFTQINVHSCGTACRLTLWPSWCCLCCAALKWMRRAAGMLQHPWPS